MLAQNYDIITVGGGIAASALAKAKAEQAARVLVLERETYTPSSRASEPPQHTKTTKKNLRPRRSRCQGAVRRHDSHPRPPRIDG